MKRQLFPCAICAIFIFLPSSICVQVQKKYYLSEKVCWDYSYGTILGNYYKISNPNVCGVKCTERSECVSFLYKKGSGWCVLNSAKFDNRTNVGCSFMADYFEVTPVLPPRQLRPPDRCVSVPYIPGVVVNTASRNFSIGSQLPYSCDPCSSFPPLGSPGYIECGINGTWIIPSQLCVNGPDVGFLRDGSAIPVNATGCFSTYNDTCPQQSSLSSGLRFDGTVGHCYCDDVCCSAKDCCYDTTCYQTSKSFFAYDYYYNYDYY